MAIASARVRADIGRVIMVPAAALMLAFDVTKLIHGSAAGAAGAWDRSARSWSVPSTC